MGVSFVPTRLAGPKAPLIALGLTALVALGLMLASHSTAAHGYTILNSLTGDATLSSSHRANLRRAIVETSAASASRLAVLNQGWDPEAEAASGRFNLGSLDLATYAAELSGNWTKLVTASGDRHDWILRRMLNRLDLASSRGHHQDEPLPKTIYSTAGNGVEPIEQFRHWKTQNPTWTVRLLDDDQLIWWLRKTFGISDEGIQSEVAERFQRLPLKILQVCRCHWSRFRLDDS